MGEETRKAVAMLQEGALLRAFTDSELQRLLTASARRELKPGQRVIEQGDKGDFAVLLLRGHLKISRMSASGREIILGYAEPGDTLGEISLLDGGERTATVTAVDAASILTVPARAFEEAALAHPGAMLRMLCAMARRVRLLNATVESDRAFSMGPRLARVLTRLLDQEGGGLRLELNQSELGNFAGLSRENVSRQLGEWESQGLLRKSGGRIEILDRAYFEELAEFGDPD